MSDLGAGVQEIRIHSGREHRVVYVAKFAEAVYVLHAFKKSRRTARKDLEIVRKRYLEVVHRRRNSQVQTMTRTARHPRKKVFRELGFDVEESEILRIRSELMIELSELIDMRGWTQAQAAEVMGVTQPRISNLVCGKIDLFSIDTLITMLDRVGVRVELSTSPREMA